jgi:hypothetical protein
MKHLKIAFGLVMVAGLMAVVASPAMAEGPRWVHCVKVAPNTGHWLTNKCTTAGTGEWETKAVTETSEVTSSTVPGSKGLELEDVKAGTAITCVGNGTGTVGPNGADSVKTITATGCEFVAGKLGSCEAAVKPIAKPRNLGWSSRIEERENTKTKVIELRDIVTSLIAGKAPGYAVECRVGGVLKVTDVCEGVISTNARANRAEGTVEQEFDKVSEEEVGTCSVGGAGQGRVSGNTINRLRLLTALWLLANLIKT